ncbi:putative NADH:ubiquinone reductase complex subunit [Sinomonas soli]
MAGSAEARWDRKALRFAIGYPVLLALGFGLASLSFHGRVPDPVAWQWDAGGGRAFIPFTAYLLGGAVLVAVVGALLCLQAALLTRPPISRRIFMAGGVGMSMFLTTVLAAGLIGQDGVPARDSHPDPIVLAMGSGATVAFTVVMLLSFKPEEQWSPKDEAALLDELEPERAASTFTYWAHARSSVFVMLSIIGVSVSLLLLVLSWWISLVLTAAALLTAASLVARVRVSPESVGVFLAGVVPVLRFDPERVLRAGFETVRARDFGGWGYRRRGQTLSVLVASGEAVTVVLDDGRRATFSGRDGDTARRVVDVLRTASGA